MKKIFAIALCLVMAMSMTTVAFAATSVTDKATLQDAVTAGGEITLANDITLDGPITVPAKEIIIDGAEKTIKFPGGAVFENRDALNMQGILSDTKLTIKNVTFESTGGPQTGYAVVTGFNISNVKLTFENCTFKNMWDAVYCNYISDPAAGNNTITINNCKFIETEYAYGQDNGHTNGVRIDAIDFVISNSESAPEAETFAVATVTDADGVKRGYKDFSQAVTAADVAPDKTVTLLKDVTADVTIPADAEIVIDASGFTLDGDLTVGTDASLTIVGGTFTDPNASDYLPDGLELNADGRVVEKFYGGYFVPSGSTSTAPSTSGSTTVTSAKTFDAGIALYVGMALTSAAGAAYVTKKH